MSGADEGTKTHPAEMKADDPRVDVKLGLDDHGTELQTRGLVEWVQDLGSKRFETGLSIDHVHEREAALPARLIASCAGLP